MKVLTEVQGPFTGYTETAWTRLGTERATLVIVSDPALVIVAFVRSKGRMGREYTFHGGEMQQLLKGHHVKLVIKGQGDGYVRLVG